MRFVVVPLLFVLLFAGPGAFLPTPSEDPWHVVREGRGTWHGRTVARGTWYVTRETGEQLASKVWAIPNHESPPTNYEPRTTYHVSRLFGGFAYGQDTTELSLNAQLVAGARNGDEALVRRALEAGAAPNSRNRAGDTALMIFIRKGNAQMVDLLLGKGADVNLRNLDKVSPLMAAAYHGHAGIARVLLDRGADMTAEDQIGKTSMVYAAGQGHSEIVGMLLDAGVDVNKLYKHDLTALMWAAGYGKTDTVRLLLEKGADPGLKDNRGKTARQIAAEAKHQLVAELLAASQTQ